MSSRLAWTVHWSGNVTQQAKVLTNKPGDLSLIPTPAPQNPHGGKGRTDSCILCA